MLRTCRVLLSIGLFVAGFSPAAEAHGIRVLLEGREVAFQRPPYLEGEEVMVPLKQAFETLGFTVGYSRRTRTILCTRGEHLAELALESILGRIDGRVVYLKAPPVVRDGTTMVPLSFLAEASGLAYRWDPASGTARAGEGAPELTLFPASAEVVKDRRPGIGAEFRQPVRPSTIRLLVDGQDFTAAAIRDSRRVEWTPPYDLAVGDHYALVEARDDRGYRHRREWRFTVALPGLIRAARVVSARRLLAGQILQVEVEGASGGRASFDIGDWMRGLEMEEVSPGFYRGFYTVREQDRGQSQVLVRVVMPDGRSEAREIPGALTFN